MKKGGERGEIKGSRERNVSYRANGKKKRDRINEKVREKKQEKREEGENELIDSPADSSNTLPRPNESTCNRKRIEKDRKFHN